MVFLICDKMLKIAILRKSLVFKNFDLLHENSSNSVIFGRIHLISFAYGHWQAILGVGWGNLEWSPWFVENFWGGSRKFKILRFRNLLTTRLWMLVARPRQFFWPKVFFVGSEFTKLEFTYSFYPPLKPFSYQKLRNPAGGNTPPPAN